MLLDLYSAFFVNNCYFHSFFVIFSNYNFLFAVLIHFINLYEIIMSRIWAGIWLQIRFKIRMEHWEGVIDLRTRHRKFNFISLLPFSISQYGIRRCKSKQKCFIWEDSGERDSLALKSKMRGVPVLLLLTMIQRTD